MRNFRSYEIWNKGMDIVDTIYTYTEKFPKSEVYGLSNQIQRAAVSIPSNIAEGCSRDSETDFCHFLEYAIGSCFEVETQSEIAKRRKFISEKEAEELSALLKTEEKQINQFISLLKQKNASKPKPKSNSH